jgi:signal transduction histidine kinase
VLAGFVLVILVTLFTAGSAVVWLIQDYQRRLAVERLSDVAVAASFIGRQLESRDAHPDEIGVIVANQLTPARGGRVRVLVLDAQGTVIAEQPAPAGTRDVSFQGRQLEVPAAEEGEGPSGRRILTRSLVWTATTDVPGRLYTFITSPPPPGVMALPGTRTTSPGSQASPPEARAEGIDRFLVRPAAYRVVLAVPERDLAAAWRELLPSLGLSFCVAVAVAVGVALWLSRSVTLPLRQITTAAQAIARGNYRQTIPVRGRDELAQLAGSFNRMSFEVERSQRALREFLANASHELRTPLTSIQGFSQALVEGALAGPGSATEAGQIINDEANRMRRLVEDLLYLSRVEAQDVPASREPIDLDALLREEWRRLQVVAEQHSLRLRFDVSALRPVLGDPDQLDRVFGNLLDNAGKYTPTGGAITLRADQAGERVRVAVNNSGAPIPAEDLPRIFDRFYRVDKSRAREIEGSGLGLAIVYEVVESHGGTITVTSDSTSGTTFTVSLPAAPAGPAPAVAASGAPAAATA